MGGKRLTLGLVVVLAGCGSAEAQSPGQRACDRTYDILSKDLVGQRTEEALEDWQSVWDHAKDADSAIRDPVETIVEAFARAADGDGTVPWRTSLRVDVAIYDLGEACGDTPG